MTDYLYIGALEQERIQLQASVTATDDGPADAERLQTLNELRDDMGDSWDQILSGGGDGLIPEHEWEEFAEQDAYSLGFIEEDSPIASYVNWSGWADALQQDYQSVEFEGTTYYYRA